MLVPDYYFDEVTEDPYDPKSELIYSCKRYMEKIVEYLYSDEPLDKIGLDDELIGICDLLDVDVPHKILTIDRVKRREFFANLDAKALYVTKKTI